MGVDVFREVERKPLGLVWIDCPSIVALGLEKMLGTAAHVHLGRKAPERSHPSLVVLCTSDDYDIASEVRRFKALAPDAAILIFSPSVDLALARAAMRAGARGVVHAGMPAEQLVRALSVARQGEVVLPRELLKELVTEEPRTDLPPLRPRQWEILKLLTEGCSNAQIAKRLFLSESSVKQHLRGTYKVLGVKSRTEAAWIFRKRGFNTG